MGARYHPGEIAVQERAGVRAGAEKIGRGIDSEVDPAAARFLARRYTLYVGSLDGSGRPWASELIGAPGFVAVTDPHHLRIAAAPGPGDPLGENLRTNPQVGLLAIDLATRRRYRVNGTAVVAPGGEIDVTVAQAFGNCPKYIQRREPTGIVEPVNDPTRLGRADRLDAEVRVALARTDTFFLATAHPIAGADVSHRGGRPGFVRTPDERTIVWPDYSGNMMFLSLGNITASSRAGILAVDFETGDVVQATGTARIDWDAARARDFPGAERIVELTVESVLAAPARSALRWRLVEPSPFNP